MIYAGISRIALNIFAFVNSLHIARMWVYFAENMLFDNKNYFEVMYYYRSNTPRDNNDSRARSGIDGNVKLRE